MSLRIEDQKKNTFVVVKNSNSNEVQQVVHLHDTKIGTSTSSKNLVVTGNSIVQGRLAGGSAGVPSLVGGRLTLTSATPITTSDVTNVSTIYYTPFETGQITLWTGSEWGMFWFDEISLVLSNLSSSKNFDIFIYANGEQVALELGTAWSGDNTRSDNLVYFHGVLCLEKDPTRRYVGTIRTTSSSLLEDSISKRFVWNFYNRVERYLYVEDTTASWTYSSAAWRQVRGQSTNKVETVFGAASTVNGSSFIMWNGASGTGVSLYTSIGIDSTTTPSATITTMLMPTLVAQYWWPSSSVLDTAVTAGYHAFNWIEYAHATGLTGMGTVGLSQSHMRIRYMM